MLSFTFSGMAGPFFVFVIELSLVDTDQRNVHKTILTWLIVFVQTKVSERMTAAHKVSSFRNEKTK
jgi:hypothetical protein